MGAIGAFLELLERLQSVNKEFLGLEQINSGIHLRSAETGHELCQARFQESQGTEQKPQWWYMTKSIDFTEVI